MAKPLSHVYAKQVLSSPDLISLLQEALSNGFRLCAQPAVCFSSCSASHIVLPAALIHQAVLMSGCDWHSTCVHDHNTHVHLHGSVSPLLRLSQLVAMQVEPVEERLMATACSDNSVCVWDVRKLSQGAKPVDSITHSLTCQSAFFAPDGG